jgi:excisionase family DNA binding protein
MTVSDLAEYLKVSDSTIYKLLRSGHIPFSLKRGNGFYFHRHEIDRWIAERQAKNWTKRKTGQRGIHFASPNTGF